MTQPVVDDSEPVALAGTRSMAASLAIPVALLIVLVGALYAFDPAQRFDNGAPPVEDIAFERTTLRPGEIELHVRNAAGTPNTIAQVLVDDAYWTFTITPSATLERYQRAVITIPYPWVEGDGHAIVLVTSAGSLFEHEIPVALATPVATGQTLGDYALIGALVGVLPVVAGMLFYPALARAADRRQDAVLALTLGVLAFLALDTVFEGLELADELPGAMQGTGLFAGSALAAMVLVLGLDRWMKGRGARPVALAVLIAIGIGLHNLGEGLLIGGAFALGGITLGTTLVAGFALHNVTEGPAIVGPLTRGAGLPWKRFVLLAALAGLPTIAGTWLGAFAASGLWSVVFFGLGAGAILVVLVQVANSMSSHRDARWSPLNLAAFALGFALMLGTAYLVAA